jgi:hypothetical protein
MIIIGLGTGRCGTQTFARMFGLPHERYGPRDLKSDVAPYYLEEVDYIHSHADARFVCLRRDKIATVASFVANNIMDEEEASAFYDAYYARAEELERRLTTFQIFHTEELNAPDGMAAFLGIQPKKSQRITTVCPLYQGKIREKKGNA